MIVVALDPGEVTGFAVYDKGLIASGEVFGHFRSCVDYVLSLGDFFIVESFRVNPYKGPALATHDILWPVEWLGALRYLLPEGAWTTQTPSQGKSIRQLRWKSSCPHEQDALRHLQYWLERGARPTYHGGPTGVHTISPVSGS